MGKHDKVVAASSDEFARNENKALRKKLADKDAELAFAAESNAKLIKENAKWPKWFNDRTSELEDEIERLKKEIALRDEKIAKLVRLYV